MFLKTAQTMKTRMEKRKMKKRERKQKEKKKKKIRNYASFKLNALFCSAVKRDIEP